MQQTLFYVDNEPANIIFRSKYQKWKYENNYRKADNDNKRCKNCKNRFITHSGQKVYYKCILLGMSSCSATDIRLSNICDNFEFIVKQTKTPKP